MSRTRDWIHSTQPGVPPPPPSRSGFSPAPTIYPGSSVSNPDASRYQRHRSQSLSHPPSSRGYSQDARSSTYRSGSGGGRMYVPSSGTYVTPDRGLPVVAKSMSQDGKTKSWVIIPPEGQRVEVVTPQRPATSMGHHHGGSGSYNYTVTSSPTSTASKASKNFVKRMLDRVEWGGKSSSSTHSRSRSIPPTIQLPSSRRSRRNSTGSGSAGFTVLSAGGSRGRESRASVSTVRAGGRRVDVIRI